MKLHRLELSAFLSYGKCEVIDFDALSEVGFFLIHGQTGAGKTSLLDAIAFALYGVLPGSREGVKSIRSDHAAADAATYVELDATVGGRRLRIRRSPEYRVPKKAGGLRRVESTVAIETWAGDEWMPVTSSKQEAGAYVRAWIGFDPDQFFRLALIPQGAFADFLSASSKARAAVLQKLFKHDLAVFERVEQYFERESAAAAQVLAMAAGDLRAERARIAEVLHADHIDVEDVLDSAWIVRREEAENERHVTLLAEQATAGAALESAATAETAAMTMIAASSAFRSAEEAVQRATLALRAHRVAIADICSPHASETEALEVLESHWRTAADEVQQLQQRNAAVDVLRALRQSVREAELAVEELQARIDATSASLDEDESRRHSLQASITAGLEAGARQANVAVRAQHAMALCGIATQRDEAIGNFSEAQDLQALAEMEVGCTEHAWREAEDLRSRSHAHDLAALLEPGLPCPVCGAAEHPAPASAVQIDAPDVESLREKLQSARTVLAHAATTRAVAQERLEQLHAQLGAHRSATASELEQAAAGLQAEANSLDAVRTAAEDAQRYIVALDSEQRVRRAAISGLRGDLARAQQVHAGAQQDMAARAAALGIDRDAPLEIEKVEPAQARRDALASFRDEERRLHAQLHAVHAAVSALGAVTTGELPNLAELKSVRIACASERLVVDEYELLSRGVIAGLQSRLTAFIAAEDRLREATTAVANLDAIAKPMLGRGRSRTRLTQYFLSARLRQILDSANSRLSRMTDGRFLFEFDADAKGAGYQSLEIAVLDAWNGARRAVATLSGGETFTASLALALGLADIVQAEAGGTALDSLFIDEGFGTLSPDFLNRVVQDLDQLRAGGRLVGIISHVDDLKQRIPMQLEVCKSASGSTVRMLIDEGR